MVNPVVASPISIVNVAVAGGSGIGKLYAQQSALAGERVVILDLNPPKQDDEAQPDLMGMDNVFFRKMDITKQDQVNAARDASIEWLGDGAIGDMRVFITAGISKRGSVMKERERNGMNLMFAIADEGTRNVFEAFREALQQAKSATAVTTGSIVGGEMSPIAGDVAYAQSKIIAQVLATTRFPSDKRFDGIKFWSALPGEIVTPLTKRELIFPMTLHAVARAAVTDAGLRAGLALAVGIGLDPFPSEPAEMLIASLKSVLAEMDRKKAAAIVRKLRTDPKLESMSVRGKFATLVGKDTGLTDRTIELLEEMGVAFGPDGVATAVRKQMETGEEPMDRTLKIYSAAGGDPMEAPITKVAAYLG